jgi:hypothetical protein
MPTRCTNATRAMRKSTGASGGRMVYTSAGPMTGEQAATIYDDQEGMRIGEFTITPGPPGSDGDATSARLSYSGVVELDIICEELEIEPREAFKVKPSELATLQRGERILYAISVPPVKWRSVRDMHLHRYAQLTALTRSAFPAQEYACNTVATFSLQ